MLEPVFVTEACGSEVLSARFSPDDGFLAAGSASGAVSIFNVSTSKEAYRLNRSGGHPMKQVCWRPEQEGSSLRTRGVLAGASTDGKLRQWHVTSSQLLSEWGDKERNGQLYCLDYSPDGTQLVAGGTGELFVFDEETKKEVVHLKGGDHATTGGHTSRVYAARYHPALGERCSVISGGWDNSVQFWDLRVGHAVRAIFGPEISGDALDISSDGKRLLTGSWREKDPLEVWDLAEGRRLEAVPWRIDSGVEVPACLLYAARFSPDGAHIAAGGSSASGGVGEAKVLRGGGGGGPVGTLAGFTCLTAAFGSAASGLVALGGNDGRVRTMRLKAGGAASTPLAAPKLDRSPRPEVGGS